MMSRILNLEKHKTLSRGTITKHLVNDTFYLRYHPADDVFWLTDQYGFVLTREDWEELNREMEKFFSIADSETINQVNNDIGERHLPLPSSVGSPINSKDRERGSVYLMQDLNDPSKYKIGLSRDVQKRLKAIGRVTLIHTIATDDMALTEATLHHLFNEKNINGEWFSLDAGDVELIKSITDNETLRQILGPVEIGE